MQGYNEQDYKISVEFLVLESYLQWDYQYTEWHSIFSSIPNLSYQFQYLLPPNYWHLVQMFTTPFVIDLILSFFNKISIVSKIDNKSKSRCQALIQLFKYIYHDFLKNGQI